MEMTNAPGAMDNTMGFSYFGARYYDSDLSVWLSVDPMSDKYPNLSPYAYCANNPVMLVDPDGRFVSYLKSNQRSRFGTFLRVQWDALTDKKFRQEHMIRKRDPRNEYFYYDDYYTNYSRPKDVDINDGRNVYDMVVATSHNHVLFKFNTEEHNETISSLDEGASRKVSEDRTVSFSGKTVNNSIKLKILFEGHDVPDDLTISDPGSGKILYAGKNLYKERVKLKLPKSTGVVNSVRIEINGSTTDKTDFDYKIIIKPKIERDFQ